MGGVVGASPLRVDGLEKVSGATKYVADLQPGKVNYARVFRSNMGHARILRLDVSEARKSPGVRRVVTGQDFPHRIGVAVADQYPIAVDTVRFFGEPVAVVVADTVEHAEQALAKIEVEYEPLEVITHPRDAVKPGAPLIHPDLGSYKIISAMHPEPGSNVAHHFKVRVGDVDSAFENAHLVVENEYWMPWIAHIPLEPHGGVAQWDGSSLTIWTSSQAPFIVRDTVAEMFHLESTQVRVVIPAVGGGFGGKSDVTIEPLLALVAYSVPGLPVELILTREESIYGTVVGRGAWGKYKTAVAADGTLLAQQVQIYFGSGGYADYSVWICQGGGANAAGPYYYPNIKIDSYAVYTNTPPTGAFRGYGHPEVHWAVERQMDIIARQLQIDPVELRLKNMLRAGVKNAIGQTLKPYNGRPDLCLTGVKEALGEKGTSSDPLKVRGMGIASFMKSPVMRTNAQSGALLRFNPDGKVTVYTGAVEIGQGTNTAMSQIAAETLGVPVEMIHYATRVDSDYSPFEWQTVASHTTWAVGNAVKLAAQDALAQIRKAVATFYEVSEETIVVENGCAYPAGRTDLSISFREIGVGLTRADGSAVNPPVMGRGTFVPPGLTNPDPETGQGNIAASWTFGSQGAEIELDLRTGQIEVLKFVTALDAGRIINPQLSRSQVEGAVVQAMGTTFMEKLNFGADGRLRNPSFVDYRIPTAVDIPRENEVIFVETEDAVGPYGARGLGEHGMVAVSPAIANAIADALGLDFFELPLSSQAIIEKIEGLKAQQGGAS